MKKQLKILRFSKYEVQLLPLLFTLSTVIILVSLGFWQISRLYEKEFLLSSMKNNLNNSPLELKSLSGNMRYVKIKMTGHFLPYKYIHLYGLRSMSTEKDGYYLITPFQTDDNKIIMVARGWFNASHKKIINNLVTNQATEVIGVILPGETTRFFIPNNDINNNIWFTLDLEQISNVWGLKLENFYIVMDNENKHSILKPLSINNLLYVRNDHLEYAITWFALAISLIVIFVMYHLRKNN